MPPKGKKGGRGRGRSKKDRDDVSDVEEEEAPALPPRPFTELEGLPSSIDEPEYNLLNNALSLKDSAVLYSSLMKSRKAYTNGNIFELYWTKSKAKAENETSARDKMNKLCDCSLQVGPHSFDVRFFILKDDEIEKKREEDKNLKKEKRLANRKVREEKLKARELKLKGKLQQAADGSIPKPDADTTTTSTTEDKPNGDDDDNNNDNESDSDDDEDDEDENKAQSREATPQIEVSEVSEVSKVSETSEVKATSEEKPPHLQEQPKVVTPKKPLPPLQIQRSLSPSTSSKSTSSSAASSSKQSTSLQKPRPTSSSKPTPASDPLQTPESQMMIANLNAIARVDPSLNVLMKIVAAGDAEPEQIKEFQGYIQRAKAMGPSPSFKQNHPNLEVAPTKKVATPPPAKVKKVKPPKDKQLTSFQELYVNGADLVFEFQESPNVRYNLPKDCIVEKLSETEYLVSVLIVHNQQEINKFLERKKARLEKQAVKDKAKETTVKSEESDSVRRSTRTKPEEPEKTKVEPTPKVPAKEEPKEPIPYFTALSFKLTGISGRYEPIFVNSFNKPDEVKAKMEDILKNGVRVPKYYIWYAVDAYRDEALAENLRNELYLVENPPKGKYKKRGRPSTDETKTEIQNEPITKKVKV